MPIGLVVHGGAGLFLEPEIPEALAACRSAVEAGLKLLQEGASALDAVEAAVRVLESAPILNAGLGAALSRDGTVELDAMILVGRDQKFGAVGAVQKIEHPVSLARLVLERTPHHLIVGTGAERFAVEQGVSLIDPQTLITDRQRKKLAEEKEQENTDTVGAVALDSEGNFAVAVSTGGLTNKLPGRVGDSPIAGAGGYADNALGAACATGTGEGIMRSLLTFRAVEGLSSGDDLQTVANRTIDLFTHRFNGDGGIIMLDKDGKAAIAHNSETMPVGWVENGEIKVQIKQSK